MDPFQAIEWSSVTSDEEVQAAICRQIASHGFVIIQPSDKLAKILREVKKMSKNFFENSKLGMSPSTIALLHLELTYVFGS